MNIANIVVTSELHLGNGLCIMLDQQDITPAQAIKLGEIANYGFEDVRDRLISEESIPVSQVDEAILEFRKFLIIILLSTSNVGMISRTVDEVWHSFILFTKDYTDFTTRVFGRFLHHQPNTKRAPIGNHSGVTFIESYNRLFGRLPRIWGPVSEECGPTTNCQDHECISCRGVPKCHEDQVLVLGCSTSCEPDEPPGPIETSCDRPSDNEFVPAPILLPQMSNCVIECGQCELVCDSD